MARQTKLISESHILKLVIFLTMLPQYAVGMVIDFLSYAMLQVY